VAEKRCHYCGKWFVPDSRVGDRQKACSVSCQKLRKRENNRLYRQKNPGYWEKHYEDCVKPWRQQHPDYQRQWREKKKAEKRTNPGEIKAERLRKVIELTERTQFYLREIQAEIKIKTKFFKRLGASHGLRYKFRLLFWRLSSRIIHRMRERIHKRLPVQFVQEVLESFNQHRISEKEAMDLLGVKRSRLHQIRKRWLLSNRKKPFGLWQRGRMPFMSSRRKSSSGWIRSFDIFGKKQICFVGSSTLPF
jgi:hypothetical protein